MPLANALERLKSDKELAPNFVEWRHIPASPPTFAPFPAALDQRLAEALARRGIERLYSHQAEAVAAVLAGRNVAVVTPTASGKTLCYNLPVLDAVARDPAARRHRGGALRPLGLPRGTCGCHAAARLPCRVG